MTILPLLFMGGLLLSPVDYLDVRVFDISFYTNACVPANNGLTASGAMTHVGVAACGPGLAFGTRILLQDGRLVTCWDRGGLISDSYLDIWVPLDIDGTETTALRLGRREMVGVIIP